MYNIILIIIIIFLFYKHNYKIYNVISSNYFKNKTYFIFIIIIINNYLLSKTILKGYNHCL